MTDADQIAVCKVIAVACMWGHGGIGSVIIDDLQKRLPQSAPWRMIYDAHAKEAQRESVGVITDKGAIDRKLADGYYLCNWDDDGCSLHRPSKYGGGLDQYVAKPLANEFAYLRGY